MRSGAATKNGRARAGARRPSGGRPRPPPPGRDTSRVSHFLTAPRRLPQRDRATPGPLPTPLGEPRPRRALRRQRGSCRTTCGAGQSCRGELPPHPPRSVRTWRPRRGRRLSCRTAWREPRARSHPGYLRRGAPGPALRPGSGTPNMPCRGETARDRAPGPTRRRVPAAVRSRRPPDLHRPRPRPNESSPYVPA